MATSGIPTRSILWVGDDSGVVDSAAESIGHDFLIIRSADGFTALEQLRGNPAPDVIVLDFALPVLEGLGFRKSQKNDPDPAIASIPVVLLTAHATDERVRKFGADAYVGKPVDLPFLIETILGLSKRDR